MVMKLFIFFLTISMVFGVKANEKMKYLCMSAKTKYERCQRDGDQKCVEQNKKIYNGSLNCSKILNGLKLKNSSAGFQSQQYKWTAQCQDLVRDHRRCARGGDDACANKLKQKHATLKCGSGLKIYLNP